MKENKLTILTDNAPHPYNSYLKSEHGLSIDVMYESIHLLCDTGKSNVFLKNAQVLGIDVSNVDTLFLSHGHSDHCGGLESLMSVNNQITVFGAAGINQSDYVSYKKEKHDISLNHKLVSELGNRFVSVECPGRWINKYMAVVTIKDKGYDVPRGNLLLRCVDRESGEERADSFVHETALVLSGAKGLTILSPCSHHGMMNIVDSCKEFTGVSRVNCFVGGLHLIDGYENVAYVRGMAKIVQEMCPEMRIYTGHCTGKESYSILSEELGEQISCFYTGMELYI